MSISSLPLPKSADVEITTRCNLQCVMCQRTYWGRPSIDMSFDLFRLIVEQIPTLTSMKLQGIGEPVLNPYFFEMICHAKEAGLYAWSYTNATLLHLNNYATQFATSSLDLLRISVDGTTAETYEQIRKGASWAQLLENISLLMKTKKSAGSALKVELWMVGMASNVDQARDLVELGADLEVDAVRIQMLANTYSYNPEVGTILTNIPIRVGPSVHDSVALAKQRASELGITFSAEWGKQSSRDDKCPWPFSRTFISAEGLVVPCGTIADPRMINFGSLLEKSFEEIWLGEAYESFRKQHLDYDIPRCCRNCYGLRA